MKTHRMSDSAHRRNARKTIAENGRSAMLRTAPPPDAMLRGRKFRRANRLSHAEAERMEAEIYGTGQLPDQPSLTFVMDEYTQAILGYDLT